MLIAVAAVGWQLRTPTENPIVDKLQVEQKIADIARQLKISKTEAPLVNTPSDKQPVELNISDKNNELKVRSHADHAASQEEIETRYTAQLLTTAQDYENQLLSMANAAREEYNETRKEGKSISGLAITYARKGLQLESQCDQEIYTILQKFESELKANSLPLDNAKLCEQEYERRKSERKTMIFKALSQNIK